MSADEPVVFVSPRQDFSPARKPLPIEEMASEEWTASVEDLPTYVLRQIAPELKENERILAAHILTSLDEDGLLTVPLYEIARYQHVPISSVEHVQQIIQHADPIGVGSSSPKEALLVQLEALSETHTVPPLARKAIEEGMDYLSRRAFTDLARLLHTSIAQTKKLAIYISDNLNPFPARAHWGEFQQSSERMPAYHEPDICITHANNQPDSPLVVEIVSPYAGSLRVNPLFRQVIDQAPADKAEEWKSALEGATLLVKCLQQRNNTMVRLMRRLVVIQRAFILHGDAYLKPITRAQLSGELQVHESTISRAVAGKAVQLPNKKIIPLDRWFDRSLNVRTALVEIIAKEENPLSDTEIMELLEKQGYSIARRTVAKYRSIEGILPAKLRQPALAMMRDE